MSPNTVYKLTKECWSLLWTIWAATRRFEVGINKPHCLLSKTTIYRLTQSHLTLSLWNREITFRRFAPNMHMWRHWNIDHLTFARNCPSEYLPGYSDSQQRSTKIRIVIWHITHTSVNTRCNTTWTLSRGCSVSWRVVVPTQSVLSEWTMSRVTNAGNKADEFSNVTCRIAVRL